MMHFGWTLSPAQVSFPVTHTCTLGSHSWINHSHICLISYSVLRGTHNQKLSFGVRNCSYSTKLFKTGSQRPIPICWHFWHSPLFLPLPLGSVWPPSSSVPWYLQPLLSGKCFSCVLKGFPTCIINWEPGECTWEPRKQYFLTCVMEYDSWCKENICKWQKRINKLQPLPHPGNLELELVFVPLILQVILANKKSEDQGSSVKNSGIHLCNPVLTFWEDIIIWRVWMKPQAYS